MAQKARANALVADLSKDQIRVASISPARKFFSSAPLTEPAQAGRPMWWWWCVARRKISRYVGKSAWRHLGQCRSAHAWTLAGYYAVASTRTLEDIAPVSERAKHQIGPNICAFQCSQTPEAAPRTMTHADISLYTTVLCASKADKISIQSTRRVCIIADRLFRAELTLPAGLPFGTYITEFFLFENGRVVGYQTGNCRWQ